MKLHLATLCAAALLAASSVSFGYQPVDGEKAPPEWVERAKSLTLKKDYPALLAMIPELDTRFARKFDTDYFSHLAGLELGMAKACEADGIFDAERVWAIHKLWWKIMLTPYADPKDAQGVLDYKGSRSSNGFSVGYRLASNAPEDQMAALRTDAIALLKAYRDFLRARVIPHYKPLFQLGPMSVADATIRTKEEERKDEAKWDKLRAISTENGYKNEEQYILTELLGKVGDAATELVWNDFSYPPVDDASPRQLLKTIPPKKYTVAQVLAGLDELRTKHRAERDAEAERLRQIQAFQRRVP